MTQTITMTYRNWRGEIAEREIAPISIWFGHTDWHTEPQWLLRATDVEKEAERDFALADCQFADLRVPAPAVPDDVAEIANTLRKATFTKGRTRGGIGGQTIEANMRSTFHEVSAWDLDRAADALEAQAAELARLRLIHEAAKTFMDTCDTPAEHRHPNDYRRTSNALRAALNPTGD